MDEVMKVWMMMVNVMMAILTALLIITVLSIPVHGAQNRTEMVTTKVVTVSKETVTIDLTIIGGRFEGNQFRIRTDREFDRELKRKKVWKAVSRTNGRELPEWEVIKLK